MNHELRITYGTSRGRDTYGYTLVSLREYGRKVATCNGGGYDMRGTVFGEWLEKTYGERLLKLAKAKPRAFSQYNWNGVDGADSRYVSVAADRKVELYGGTYYANGQGKSEYHTARAPFVSLNGACGFRSMQRIAEAIGLKVRILDAGNGQDIVLVEDAA